MSTNENHEHESAIKTPGQLITVVVLAFVVPIIIIVLLVKLVTGGSNLDKASAAMSPEAVAKRIQPVADVKVAEPVAAQVAAAPGKPDGRKVYDSTCGVCHGPGVAGAPKLGDKAAWAPHLVLGTQGLYQSALKGKNAMPPKGGNLALPDADVRAAVDYMVAAAK